MCALVTGTNQEEAAGAITQIGLDAIRGETEMCIMAIGMGQLIGRCVGRDKQTGRFVSLTRRTLIGAYTDVEPVELERRPNPRKAPAVAARLVIGVVLAVIAAIAPKAAPAARLAALLLSAGASAAQWGAGYGRREFIHDQWPLVLILAPCWAFLIWLVIR
jgi:hypothetical protein